MTVYCISDLHLNEQSPELTALWRQFLQDYVQPGVTLYILGDFFDLWIGDDVVTDYQISIMDDLKRVTDAGITVYFMVGNRDFLIGKTFARATGVTLLADPSLVIWKSANQEYRVLLKHGDDLCIHDRRHQWFRRFSRAALIRTLFLALPTAWRRKIADYCREHSRGKMGYSVILDADRGAVQDTLEFAAADILIHGHTHRPGIDIFFNENQSTRRYVLADWHENGSFLRWNPLEGLEICYFHTH